MAPVVPFVPLDHTSPSATMSSTATVSYPSMIDYVIGADSRKQIIRLFMAPPITAPAVDKAAALSHLFCQLDLHASTITIPNR